MLSILAVVAVADQIAKAFVRLYVAPTQTIEVIPSFVNLIHVRNTGAAFGFLNQVSFPGKSWIVVGVATLALVGIVFYAGRFTHGFIARVGFALILGGAVGNLVDRIWLGYVLDFVDVYWRDYHFWAFNVADSAITVGACLLIGDMLRSDSDASQAT